MICGGENGTNGCHLAGFSEDVAFARRYNSMVESIVEYTSPVWDPPPRVSNIWRSFATTTNINKLESIQSAIICDLILEN